MPLHDSQMVGSATFRVDASTQIGTGHVMRCLTLADELKRHGMTSRFTCRPFEGDLRAYIKTRGHEVATLSPGRLSRTGNSGISYDQWLGVSWAEDVAEVTELLTSSATNPDWLIVDHYGLDRRWESAARPYVGNIMVIDDLANRAHDCDLLLDQNLYESMDSRYAELIGQGCCQLLGPRYALLRDEFRRARAALRDRSGEIERILIFFGGIDQSNLTERAIRALVATDDKTFKLDVVIGKSNVRRPEIESLCSSIRGATLHVQTSDMAELIAKADLSIGAGGTTTWERAFLGLPGLTTIVADNQREMTEATARAGICWNLGWHEQVTVQSIAERLREACACPQLMRKMSRQALSLAGGKEETGTALVVSAMLGVVHVHA